MTVAAQLTRLEDQNLVHRLTEADLAYFFRHALVQDTAYASLLKNERRRLHRLIGEAIEREYPNARAENAARLTQHFAEAGNDAKTLEYGRTAGQAAARVYAYTEAITHYQAALQAALNLGADRETIVELVTRLGRLQELHSDFASAIQTYARLVELAKERGDPAFELAGLVLEATLRSTPTAVFDPSIGRAVLDRALALARELNDRAALAKIFWNLVLLNGFTGHHQAAIEYGEQSLALARGLGLKTQIAYTLNDLANYGYFSSGDLARARPLLAEARALWRELDNKPMLSDNLNNSGIGEYLAGDYAAAQEYSDAALAISEEIGSLWGISLAHSFRGGVALEHGDYEAALAELRPALTLAREAGSGIAVIAGTMLSLLYANLGDLDSAYNSIKIARGEIQVAFYRAPAQATLAYVTFLRGNVTEARELLHRSRPSSPEELEFSFLPRILAEGEIGLATGSPAAIAVYMRELGARLEARGLLSFISDACFYQARAHLALEENDAARLSFERGYTYAQQLGSRRSLWRLCAHWAQLERTLGNSARAAALDAESHATLDWIRAQTPESYRAALQDC